MQIPRDTSKRSNSSPCLSLAVTKTLTREEVRGTDSPKRLLGESGAPCQHAGSSGRLTDPVSAGPKEHLRARPAGAGELAGSRAGKRASGAHSFVTLLSECSWDPQTHTETQPQGGAIEVTLGVEWVEWYSPPPPHTKGLVTL